MISNQVVDYGQAKLKWFLFDKNTQLVLGLTTILTYT
jgi:hypothetical protein